MENYNQNIEDLIAKHLAGESDADEKIMLADWLNESDSNRAYFEVLQKIFNESASLKKSEIVDTDAAWNKLKSQIKNQEDGSIRILKPETRVTLSAVEALKRIAAVFLIFALATAAYFFFMKENIETITIASANETKTFLLPDSSTVFLNKNSQLAYTFSKEKREINLTGEAFFEVKHDETKPFIIHANDLNIKDIGTSFNVNAKSKDSVQIIVESGEVELTTAINPDYNYSYRLTPGQQAVFNKNTKRIIKTETTDSNAFAYKTKVFVFENASLQSAVQKLNEVYGTEITIRDKIKNCRITSTFKNEKIDAILDVIVTTLNLKLTKNENKITLDGEGCDE